VPPAIDAVIAKFDDSTAPFDEHAVREALVAARTALVNPTPADNLGAWAEVLAFGLARNQERSSPWKTYFGPVATGTKKDGSPYYAPDIAGTEPEVIAHWARRARDLRHPILKARYADVAWDLSRAIARSNPDPNMARIAIDAYLVFLDGDIRSDIHDRFHLSLRALNLAAMIRDPARTERAKIALLRLHRSAMNVDRGPWWIAIERLIDDKKVGLTDGERDQLTADLEGIIARRSDISDAKVFDPFVVESAAKRLIKHYRKRNRHDDVKRLHAIVGRTFEHLSSLGNAMLASAHLQTAVNAFRDAGLPSESTRARIAMEKKIAQSHDEVSTFTFERLIPKEDMDEAMAELVVDDLGLTFAHIAGAFLQSQTQLEKGVKDTLEHAPLMAMIGQSIVGEHHIAATVGSVADDPFGRVIRQALDGIALADIWLINALDRAVDAHDLSPGHFASWAGRSGLFDDLTLLMEGVTAWFDQDYVKAVHVLVPQVEKGLRGIASKLNRPITKPHSTLPGVGVAIGMGDILYNDEMRERLGPELTLHFLTLYADPRGFNLRNEVAHGLIGANGIHHAVATRIIHTLLVFGIWEVFAKRRKDAT
jgi:lysyl-tRNA synthetase class 1